MSFHKLSPFLLFALFCASPAAAVDFDPGANPPYAAAILVEAETGTVLFEHNSRVQRSPASTLKLLFQLVVMELLEDGRVKLDEEVQVSREASRIGGSQVYLKQGEVFTLEKMMEAIAISSANDACAAVAEHIGGSVEGFVDMMNDHAGRLGLDQTYFVNVHGLDDTPKYNRNLTTAYDLSRIARALVRYPQALEWSSIRRKPFRPGKFTLYNTNGMLGRFRGMDGLKTGFTSRAGSCLVATAQRRNMRLISVILGAGSERIRERETARLLNWGFNTYKRVPLAQAGETMGEVVLEWGKEPGVEAQARDTVIAILSFDQAKLLQHRIELPAEYPAPVDAGDELGMLKVSLGDSLLATVELVAARSVESMGMWERLMSYF